LCTHLLFVLEVNFHYELNNNDPYKHLNEFLEMCSTIKMQNFFEDALKIRLCPFSLKDKAKYCFNSLEANTIRTKVS